jgi:heme exporter protein CcmD
MADFFAMGGYARFIWPAYIITAVVLIAAIAVSLQAHISARRSVQRLEEDSGDDGESQT